MFRCLRKLSLGVVVAVVAIACRANTPGNRPIEACQASCEKKADRHCSSAECYRGCELILDRIIERESDNVISCVARHPRRCSDVVWADCAARVGVHADGGPAPPPPPKEDWE